MIQLFRYSIILILSLFLTCCSKSADPQPATLYVRISGECLCNVFIYTPEGLCLQSKIWDCNETSVLTFNIYHEGTITIKAEYRDKTTTQSIQTQYNQSREISLLF